MANHPQFVTDILDQLGRGLNGAIVYCGGRQLLYCQPETAHPLYPHAHNGIFTFVPNIDKKAVMLIAVELTDTYFVSLFVEREPYGEPMTGVYDDMLQGIVESKYDNYIKQEQKGWISL